MGRRKGELRYYNWIGMRDVGKFGRTCGDMDLVVCCNISRRL
jgi:hypothetical protein